MPLVISALLDVAGVVQLVRSYYTQGAWLVAAGMGVLAIAFGGAYLDLSAATAAAGEVEAYRDAIARRRAEGNALYLEKVASGEADLLATNDGGQSGPKGERRPPRLERPAPSLGPAHGYPPGAPWQSANVRGSPAGRPAPKRVASA